MKNIDLKENIVPDFDDFSGPRTLKYFMNDPSYDVKKTSGRLKRDVSEDKTDLENEHEVVGLPKNMLRFEINPRNTERSRKPSHLNVHEGKERLKRDALDDKRISENENVSRYLPT
uniref:Uncharacterized protein n=1 Tax=Cacopsylla melanoneura TaxID=428564 RepID=A0A8D9BLD7_9HEMI